MPSAPRAVKLILAVVVGLIVLIIIYSLFFGGGGKWQPYINLMARQQEIVRATNLAQQQFKLQDPQTQALAATVSATVSSEEQQLTNYLATNKVKVSPAQLATGIDKTTDEQFKAASQNNNLDQVYVAYLKDNLTRYQLDIQPLYKSAGTKGKAILKEAFDSAGTILASPQFKS